MPLHEAEKFGRAHVDPSRATLERVFAEHAGILNQQDWTHCGYAELSGVDGATNPVREIRQVVDNGFRLGPSCGFESLPVVVTTGVRTSRFASVIFWEVLHALAPDGVWLDIDDATRCQGGALTADDYLERSYFSDCLQRETRRSRDQLLVQTYRKTQSTPIAARIDDTGWTFGILTSGASDHGGQMAAAILALDLPSVEVVFCGPRPANAPDDERVRVIDLDHPEPRGWISRKKNLLADTAVHENLCLLHDRYVITSRWADALRTSGPCFSFLTFPHVYYVDRDRRFTQRYADYQVLYQRQGLQQALADNVYVGDNVFYPAYDDFYETAFCCGGLYVTKRSLWNLVRQDEGLYHCEWEDISFGLSCQRRGIPHRVSRAVTVESTTPHPTTLTRVNDMPEPDVPVRRRLHIVPAQRAEVTTNPSRFKPLFPRTRGDYYERVINRFNVIPDLSPADRLSDADVASCAGLSDFWQVIESRLLGMSLRSRAQLAAVAAFLSDTIYRWPNCEVLAAIRDNERVRRPVARLSRATSLVGWGTGSAFRKAHGALDRPLDFVVDRDETAWGTWREGVEVRPPHALRALDPGQTTVVVFSCFFDEIAEAIRSLGDFTILHASDVTGSGRLQPLTDLVMQFDEVERYYPVVFLDSDVNSTPRCAA